MAGVLQSARGFAAAVVLALVMLHVQSETIRCWNTHVASYHVMHQCYRDLCRCNNYTLDCSSTRGRLTYVPRVLDNMQVLNFSNNHLLTLPPAFFVNVSRTVWLLDLYNNGLTALDPLAFSHLPRLSALLIGGNVLNYSALAPLLAKLTLRTLDIKCGGMGSPPAHSFVNTSLANSLEYLDLSWNQIHSLDMAVLQPLHTLRNLSVCDNKMYELKTAYLPSVQYLNFHNNVLQQFPQTCKPGTRDSLFPDLTAFHLDFNVITEIPDPVCLPSLKVLDLSYNRFRYFQSDMFSGARFPALNYLEVTNMEKEIRKMASFAFNNSALVHLGFGANRLDFASPVVDDDVLGGLHNLRHLSLDKSDFQWVTEDRLHRLLWHVPQLDKLYLGSCQLTSITPTTFTLLPRLRELHLYQNVLSSLPDGAFDRLQNLRLLQLANNRISVVHPTAFNQTTRERLQSVNLSGNPFQCGCDVLWFQAWLTQELHKFRSYRDQDYMCANLHNTTVQKFYLNEQACILSTIQSILTIVLTSLIIVVLTVWSVCYSYRWYLRLRRGASRQSSWLALARIEPNSDSSNTSRIVQNAALGDVPMSVTSLEELTRRGGDTGIVDSFQSELENGTVQTEEELQGILEEEQKGGYLETNSRKDVAKRFQDERVMRLQTDRGAGLQGDRRELMARLQGERDSGALKGRNSIQEYMEKVMNWFQERTQEVRNELDREGKKDEKILSEAMEERQRWRESMQMEDKQKGREETQEQERTESEMERLQRQIEEITQKMRKRLQKDSEMEQEILQNFWERVRGEMDKDMQRERERQMPEKWERMVREREEYVHDICMKIKRYREERVQAERESMMRMWDRHKQLASEVMIKVESDTQTTLNRIEDFNREFERFLKRIQEATERKVREESLEMRETREENEHPTLPPEGSNYLEHVTVFSTALGAAIPFSDTGGTLRLPQSDVILYVPENAVGESERVVIHAAVSTDICRAAQVLGLPPDHFVCSPVAEYWAGHGFRFRKLVTIRLPHFLPPNPDAGLVHVYRLVRRFDGQIAITRVRQARADTAQRLSTDTEVLRSVNVEDEKELLYGNTRYTPSQRQSSTPVLADSSSTETSSSKIGEGNVAWDDSASFELRGHDFIQIRTSHFSAYVCTYGHSGPPLLYTMSWGRLTGQQNSQQTADVFLYVWDGRLCIQDFRQAYCLKDEEHIQDTSCLDVVPGLADSRLCASLCVAQISCTDWQHSGDDEGQPLTPQLQEYSLKTVLTSCDVGDCARASNKTGPISARWMLETGPGKNPESQLQGIIKVSQVARGTAASWTNCDDLEATTRLLVKLPDYGSRFTRPSRHSYDCLSLPSARAAFHTKHSSQQMSSASCVPDEPTLSTQNPEHFADLMSSAYSQRTPNSHQTIRSASGLETEATNPRPAASVRCGHLNAHTELKQPVLDPTHLGSNDVVLPQHLDRVASNDAERPQGVASNNTIQSRSSGEDASKEVAQLHHVNSVTSSRLSHPAVSPLSVPTEHGLPRARNIDPHAADRLREVEGRFGTFDPRSLPHVNRAGSAVFHINNYITNNVGNSNNKIKGISGEANFASNKNVVKNNERTRGCCGSSDVRCEMPAIPSPANAEGGAPLEYFGHLEENARWTSGPFEEP